MTEHLDKLIHLFRKARLGTEIIFQDEEVKNRLLAGLPYVLLVKIKGYLDLMAAEITRTYDAIHRHREATGCIVQPKDNKPLLAVQNKQLRGDDPQTYGEFEQVFSFRDGNNQNKYKYETCTYCQKRLQTMKVTSSCLHTVETGWWTMFIIQLVQNQNRM